MTKAVQTVSAATPADLLTDEQAAALLNIKTRTLRLWRHSRGLPFLKLTSKVVRYRKTDLDAWLDSHRVAVAA